MFAVPFVSVYAYKYTFFTGLHLLLTPVLIFFLSSLFANSCYFYTVAVCGSLFMVTPVTQSRRFDTRVYT